MSRKAFNTQSHNNSRNCYPSDSGSIVVTEIDTSDERLLSSTLPRRFAFNLSSRLPLVHGSKELLEKIRLLLSSSLGLFRPSSSGWQVSNGSYHYILSSLENLWCDLS